MTNLATIEAVTPSPEQRWATEVIREQAAGHAVSETNPNARHALIPRERDYVHPFYQVYFEPYPVGTSIDPDDVDPDMDPVDSIVESITDALGKALNGTKDNGPDKFEGLVDTLAKSPDFKRSLRIIKIGGNIAALGAHRELFDTCAMEAAFLVAAHRVDPKSLAELIQGSRINVGTIMYELALRSLSEKLSTIDSLRFLGGVFKAFPDTKTTKHQIEEEGLDYQLFKSTNLAMAMEFRRQVRENEIKVANISPSGATDILQDRADGEGREYVLQRASNGTDTLLSKFDGWLPIVMQLSPEPDYRVGKLILARKERTIHRVMAGPIAKLSSELNANEGIRTVYEGDPVTEPKTD